MTQVPVMTSGSELQLLTFPAQASMIRSGSKALIAPKMTLPKTSLPTFSTQIAERSTRGDQLVAHSIGADRFKEPAKIESCDIDKIDGKASVSKIGYALWLYDNRVQLKEAFYARPKRDWRRPGEYFFAGSWWVTRQWKNLGLEEKRPWMERAAKIKSETLYNSIDPGLFMFAYGYQTPGITLKMFKASGLTNCLGWSGVSTEKKRKQEALEQEWRDRKAAGKSGQIR